tara:strand:+ start:173 stop:691 length:519 start_codon:yes stop_codon:yes gene_type:complete
MLTSIFGYFFPLIGLVILVLPLILVELSRPRDWLIGGLFLFLGLFLLVEKDLLRGSINLFVIAVSIMFGKMMSEISQNRWNQLSLEEKKRIGSFERWLESCKQLGQVFAQLGNSIVKFFKSFNNQSQKSSKEKKWVHPELKKEIKQKSVDTALSIKSNKIRIKESTENEESS